MITAQRLLSSSKTEFCIFNNEIWSIELSINLKLIPLLVSKIQILKRVIFVLVLLKKDCIYPSFYFFYSTLIHIYPFNCEVHITPSYYYPMWLLHESSLLWFNYYTSPLENWKESSEKNLFQLFSKLGHPSVYINTICSFYITLKIHYQSICIFFSNIYIINPFLRVQQI